MHLGLSLQQRQIQNINQFQWMLNPYQFQLDIEQELDLMTIKTAKIIDRLNKDGLLPEYAKEFLNINKIKGLASLEE
jgi:hypothetical protein